MTEAISHNQPFNISRQIQVLRRRKSKLKHMRKEANKNYKKEIELIDIQIFLLRKEKE